MFHSFTIQLHKRVNYFTDYLTGSLPYNESLLTGQVKLLLPFHNIFWTFWSLNISGARGENIVTPMQT